MTYSIHILYNTCMENQTIILGIAKTKATLTYN